MWLKINMNGIKQTTKNVQNIKLLVLLLQLRCLIVVLFKISRQNHVWYVWGDDILYYSEICLQRTRIFRLDNMFNFTESFLMKKMKNKIFLPYPAIPQKIMIKHSLIRDEQQHLPYFTIIRQKPINLQKYNEQPPSLLP